MSLLIKSRVRIVEIYLECEYIEEVMELELQERIRAIGSKTPLFFELADA